MERRLMKRIRGFGNRFIAAGAKSQAIRPIV